MNGVEEISDSGSPSEINGSKCGNVIVYALPAEPRDSHCVPRMAESVGNHNGGQSSTKRRSADREEVSSHSQMSAKRWIGRFFFENGIDLGSVESPSFQKMMEISANERDIESCIPTAEELQGWVLSKEQKEVQNYVETIKASWTRTGCSILLDGWVTAKGRNLLNVVVDSPLGAIYLRSFDVSNIVDDVDGMVHILDDVIAQVGAQNVVQVVSHTASRCMDAVGERLIVKLTVDKAKTITRFFYSYDGALTLMRKHTSSSDLLKSSKFEAALPFLTLENILKEYKNLEKLVTSAAWSMSPWASEAEANRVAGLVLDKAFCDELSLVVRATIPLVKVLFLINGDARSHLGFIYETMDQVKETICEELRGEKPQYMPFWEVIDEVWNEVLHSPLHAAGYFLNPSLHYSEDFFADPEVTGGLLTAVVRMVEDLCTQDLVTQQLDAYRACYGSFKKGTQNKRHENLPPADWWSSYGSHCPDLQKLAIRILSQTCSGVESYGMKRDKAETLLSSGTNHSELQKLSNYVYVHYNVHLKQSKISAKFLVHTKEGNSMVDWITDELHHLRNVRPKRKI